MKASRPTPAEFLMRVVGSPTPTFISFMFQRLYRQSKNRLRADFFMQCGRKIKLQSIYI